MHQVNRSHLIHDVTGNRRCVWKPGKYLFEASCYIDPEEFANFMMN